MTVLALPAVRRMSGLAPVVLRVAAGVVMAYHGWTKLKGGPEGFAAGVLGPKGVVAPEVMAWVVTLVELIGGGMLVLGLLTRIVALPLIGVVTGAVVLVKKDSGLIGAPGTGAGLELELVLFAGLVAVLLLGPGRPSLDQLLKVE